jgi:multidrug efflux pump subunit AcrA (membrane-fusion protein)
VGQDVNKLKVAVQDLRDHLGRDSRGLNLLDRLTAIANEQRTRCAAMEASAAASKAAAERLRRDLDDAQSKIVATQAERDRETSIRVAAESRARALAKQIADTAEPVEEDAALQANDRRARVLALLSKVMGKFRKVPVRTYGTTGGLVVEEIVKRFAYDEFADLGMVMALCAIFRVPLNLRSEAPMKPGEEFTETQLARFIHWYGDAIDMGGKWQTDVMYRTGNMTVNGGG